MNISFRVDGMPPRKDGGTSMWKKEKEVNKIVSLRRSLNEVLQFNKIATPINLYLKLNVEIHLPKKHLQKSDIDNLVGGIFDGIQKADNRSNLHNGYEQYLGTPIHPAHSFISNDSIIIEVNAKKFINEQQTYYTVSIESVNTDEIVSCL